LGSVILLRSSGDEWSDSEYDDEEDPLDQDKDDVSVGGDDHQWHEVLSLEIDVDINVSLDVR